MNSVHRAAEGFAICSFSVRHARGDGLAAQGAQAIPAHGQDEHRHSRAERVAQIRRERHDHEAKDLRPDAKERHIRKSGVRNESDASAPVLMSMRRRRYWLQQMEIQAIAPVKPETASRYV